MDVKPGSSSYGSVIYSSSVEGRNEAHHGGFTDDRRQLWLCGLETSKIFIFDVYSQPARPRCIKTIAIFEQLAGGAVGPHGVYALPGRVLIPCLSNAKDHGGRTALVEFSNEGDYIATHWLPTRGMPGIVGAEFADGYNYDARVLPRKNVLLTTSFTGWNNYTREFGELAKVPEAMKQFGNSMVVWNFHTRQPKKAFQVPGAPLEIRWAWREKNNYAFTATTLASKLQTAAPWHFVTARSQPELQPILDAYGQAVDKKANPLDPTGPLNHTVRVFLIDGEGDIRNIYSSGTLDPRLILADVRTLMLETDLAHHQTRRASIVQ